MASLALVMAVAYAANSPPRVTGRASIRCVLPIFLHGANCSAFLESEPMSASIACTAWTRFARMATCIAVGNVSLLDWDMFTWSFGCRCWYCPFSLPIISSATLAITSFEFMLKAVPAPELIASTTNWSTNRPARI